MKRRKGRFKLSREVLREPDVGIFQPFMIFDVIDHVDEKEYIAISPLFDSIEQGVKIPEYEIEITKDRVGNHIFNATRIENAN